MKFAYRNTSEQGVSFAAIYHPKLKDLDKLTKNLQLFLYSNSEVRRVFSPPPIVSYGSARKMEDYTERSKIYPTKRIVVCSRYGNPRCQVCKSIQVTNTFLSFATKSAHKFNHNFNCNSNCLIYLLSCKTCGKQYTGKTVDKFTSRCNNYKTHPGKGASGKRESFSKTAISSKSFFAR